MSFRANQLVWVETIDRKGRKYWYHRHTRRSTWTDPYDIEEDIPPPPPLLEEEDLTNHSPLQRVDIQHNDTQLSPVERYSYRSSTSTVSSINNLNEDPEPYEAVDNELDGFTPGSEQSAYTNVGPVQQPFAETKTDMSSRSNTRMREILEMFQRRERRDSSPGIIENDVTSSIASRDMDEHIQQPLRENVSARVDAFQKQFEQKPASISTRTLSTVSSTHNRAQSSTPIRAATSSIHATPRTRRNPDNVVQEISDSRRVAEKLLERAREFSGTPIMVTTKQQQQLQQQQESGVASNRHSSTESRIDQLYRSYTGKEGINTSHMWVECQEVLTRRKLYYHRDTMEIAFDSIPSTSNAPPPTVQSPIRHVASESRRSMRSTVEPTPTPANVNSQVVVSPSQITTERFPRRTLESSPGSIRNRSHDPTSIVRQTDELTSMSELPMTAATSRTSLHHHRRDQSFMTSGAGTDIQLNQESFMQTILKDVIGYKRLQWKFDQESVRYFRAQVSRIDHKQYLPDAKELACPRYLSNLPFKEENLLMITIQLPKLANKAMTHTKVHCSASDTADAVISRVLKKCLDNHEAPSTHILKVTGKEQYIYGDVKLMDFHYCRQCVRTGTLIALQLRPVDRVDLTIEDVCAMIESDQSTPVYSEELKSYPIYTDKLYNDALHENIPLLEFAHIPVESIKLPLRFQIEELENIEASPRYDSSVYAVAVQAELYHGTQPIGRTQVRTRFRKEKDGWRYYHHFAMPLELRSLPRSTKIAFTVYGVKVDGAKDVLLAYVCLQLFAYDNVLTRGRRKLEMWTLPLDNSLVEDDLKAIARRCPLSNRSTSNPPILFVRFEEFLKPVIIRSPKHIRQGKSSSTQMGVPVNLLSLTADIRKRLDDIIRRDPLATFDDEERSILWTTRHNFIQDPTVLPRFLRCVDWCSRSRRAEAYRMMYLWAKPTHPTHALELLDAHFADGCVRQYAVDIISELQDSALQDILLQLTQALKYEPYHDSSLARFLIRRSISNPYQIGHYFFWNLKSELHNPEVCERFTLLLEEYLLNFPFHARQLHRQCLVVKSLLVIAEDVRTMKAAQKLSDEALLAEMRRRLRALNDEFNTKWQIPLDPSLQVRKIVYDSCKYFSSKKVPLLLILGNADDDGEDIVVMFKAGDDLRQDVLTLQILRSMDRIWSEAGFEMKLTPYGCIATGIDRNGDGVGFIEIVLRSKTISRIQIDEGGGALGALKKLPLSNYLKKHNDDGAFEAAVETFMRSCAGYCVATFCLGIGDRHNDNIMLTQDGHLFHIDFGHILGNFKSKYGFKRERTPFVFTPEMAHVMGGLKTNQYKQFVDLCCNVFNLLRKNSFQFMTLFSLMLSAGMPELSTVEDIFYFRDRLLLNLSESEASSQFKKEIKSSHGDFYRRVDNTIHNLKHR